MSQQLLSEWWANNIKKSNNKCSARKKLQTEQNRTVKNKDQKRTEQKEQYKTYEWEPGSVSHYSNTYS